MSYELERYMELVVYLRNNDKLPDEQYDIVLDEMDALWYAMDISEHAEVEKRVKELM